jgi:hypothetical protein
MSSLPKDAVLLLSVVNMKLRDYYSGLDALCEDLDENREALCERLAAIGYSYDENLNQFV